MEDQTTVEGGSGDEVVRAIDLHSNNNVTVVIDEQDRVVYQKRLPNDLPLITQQLSAYRDQLEGIVVASTFNWYWLVDGLMDQGHRVHLANTTSIQQYEGLKYTKKQSASGQGTAAGHLFIELNDLLIAWQFFDRLLHFFAVQRRGRVAH